MAGGASTGNSGDARTQRNPQTASPFGDYKPQNQIQPAQPAQPFQMATAQPQPFQPAMGRTQQEMTPGWQPQPTPMQRPEPVNPFADNAEWQALQQAQTAFQNSDAFKNYQQQQVQMQPMMGGWGSPYGMPMQQPYGMMGGWGNPYGMMRPMPMPMYQPMGMGGWGGRPPMRGNEGFPGLGYQRNDQGVDLRQEPDPQMFQSALRSIF